MSMKNGRFYGKYKDASYYDLNHGLYEACRDNNIEETEYLLNNKDLTSSENIHYNLDSAFLTACQQGHFEIVKLLCTSPWSKEKININANKGEAIRKVFGLDIVKYLLTSPDLKEHINVHIKKDSAFKSALERKDLDVLSFFIFDLDIDKTPYIEKYLQLMPNNEVEKMFAIRDLNRSLNNELESRADNIKKNKL
jgi:hypothetical protein